MVVLVLAGVAGPQAYATGDDREKRSADVLQELVPSPDGPGCAAAVGMQGSVVWEAGRGKADLTTGRAITSKTVFDMASNSKQFTADAVLLLDGRHLQYPGRGRQPGPAGCRTAPVRHAVSLAPGLWGSGALGPGSCALTCQGARLNEVEGPLGQDPPPR
ncbi:serine hydrolase domain-containing protein [Streptomyces sp. NBC_01408]|uniref:serine hydrolase domain-containing protein n=1 Tax=Streptomyces sp. NBC_01408 TaxID=2903855 RepID=UPI00338F3613